jgi:hypothetical protein
MTLLFVLQATVPLVRLVTVTTLVDTVDETLTLAPDTLKHGPPAGLTHWAATSLMAARRFPAESLALAPYRTLPTVARLDVWKVYVVAPISIVLPAASTPLKVAVPVVFTGIKLVSGFNNHAVWEEVQVKGIGLPVMLVTVTYPVFVGAYVYVSAAVTLGFGAVINE